MYPNFFQHVTENTHIFLFGLNNTKLYDKNNILVQQVSPYEED